MSKMELVEFNNITWNLVKKARHIRDRYKISFPTYFYRLSKEELYNLVREKINQYYSNQERLRKYNNRIVNEFISTFDNYDFKGKDEIINLPFSKVKNNDRD